MVLLCLYTAAARPYFCSQISSLVLGVNFFKGAPIFHYNGIPFRCLNLEADTFFFCAFSMAGNLHGAQI